MQFLLQRLTSCVEICLYELCRSLSARTVGVYPNRFLGDHYNSLAACNILANQKWARRRRVLEGLSERVIDAFEGVCEGASLFSFRPRSLLKDEGRADDRRTTETWRPFW